MTSDLATRIRRRKQPASAGLIEVSPLWSQLSMTILTATFQAVEDCHLPEFKGSTLRGAFGHSLVAMSGHVTEGKCPRCERGHCGYGYIFTEQSVGNGRNAILPLIIQPPLDTRLDYVEGDTFTMKMTLVGDAVGWIPNVAWALGRMGEKGLGFGKAPWDLVELQAMQPNGSAVSLLESFGEIPVVSGLDIVKAWPDFDRCEIHFQTPTCIRSDGKMLERFDAVTLIKRLNGRLGDLLETFCGVAPNVFDMRTLNEAAEQIQIDSASFEPAAWERYSTRSGHRHNVDGITGTMTLSNIPMLLTPLLVLGQYLHIGKSAAFGMGGYQLIPR